jgi:hypothetical protein
VEDADDDQVGQAKGHEPRSCRNWLIWPIRRSQHLQRVHEAVQGPACAVWTGIGAAGAATAGMVFLGDAVSMACAWRAGEDRARFGSPPNLHAVSAGYPAVPGGLEVGADEEWRLMMVTPGWDRVGSDASYCGAERR